MKKPGNRKDGPLILVTDIDGTLARGTAQENAKVYELLRDRPHTALIYVTSRPIEEARAYQESLELPPPLAFVAERGSSVARGRRAAPLAYVDCELDRRWPGARAVRDDLKVLEPYLDELPNTGPRHLAYVPAEGTSPPELADMVATRLSKADNLDVDVVQTGDGCVDIVPKNVTSGFTVDRVLAWLKADPDWVVAAADTLRHAGLFRPGRRGIVVAKADEGLKARLRAAARPETYMARRDGAAGVLEGLTYFGYVTPSAVAEAVGVPEGQP